MNTQTITLTPFIDGVQYGIDKVKENWNAGDLIATTNIPVEKIKAIDRNYSTHPHYEYLIEVESSRNQYKNCEVYGKILFSSNPKDQRFPYLVMPSKEQEVITLAKDYVMRKYSHKTDKEQLFCYKHIESFIAGFNANKGIYTQEQMEKAFRQGELNEGSTACAKTFDEFLQSLQPTAKAVRVEMEEIRSPEFGNCPHFKEVGCIKDICTCYTLKIKVETSQEYPQGVVKALEVIY